mmetsp:Transcript_62715/g.186963  ORF Transcript_62715/g.186963 Transcript_62715/m.186963 type:complete len:318 (+) Transcript_62715:93-1046(+)
MAGQHRVVAVSKTSTQLARIEEEILGLPEPEFEALSEWFTMVLTLRRAVSGHQPDQPGGFCKEAERFEWGDAEVVDAAGSTTAESPGEVHVLGEADVPQWQATGRDTPDAAEAPRGSEEDTAEAAQPSSRARRRATKIQNRRFSTADGAGAGTASGTPEPSNGSQDGDAGADPYEVPSSSAPSMEGRALLALCGGGRTYYDWAEGRQALEELCGEWRDTTSSIYQVSMCPSGDRLNVSTRRPRTSRAMFTRGLIRLQEKPDGHGFRIVWGAKASFVLISPNDQLDTVQWASPDNYRKPFEWRRSPRRGSYTEDQQGR